MRLLCLVALVLVATVLVPGQAGAISLTNTSVTYTQLNGFFDFLSPVASLTDTFDFAPFAAQDGTAKAAVYAGDGSYTGLYLYAYQIIHDAASSEAAIHGYSVGFTPLYTLLNIDGDGGGVADTSWYCTDCDEIFGADGTKPSSFGNHTGGSLSFGFWDGLPGLPAGEIVKGATSHVFGVISTLPPTTTTANLQDDGDEASPLSLTPVPEPGTLLLLGGGLLGLGFGGRRVRRSRPL